MQGLFNQAPIGPKFSDNWVYSGRGLLSQGHGMSPGCEEKGCLQGGKKRRSLVSGVLKRFPLQKREPLKGEDNYSPDIHHSAAQSNTCLFVVFVPAFDKIVKTELPFNKEPALPLCSSKNQHFTREAEKNCMPNRKSLFLPFTM